jgi:hypothetical protein
MYPIFVPLQMLFISPETPPFLEVGATVPTKKNDRIGALHAAVSFFLALA